MGDAASIPTGIAAAMGPATPTAATPALLLQAELNRFANQLAPQGFQYFGNTLSSGLVDAETAARAIRVIIQRGLDVELNSRTPADGIAIMNEANAAIYGGGGGPVPWLANNIASVTQLVAGFADAHGLPPAQIPGEDLTKTLLIGGAIVVVLGLLFKRKRAKGRRR